MVEKAVGSLKIPPTIMTCTQLPVSQNQNLDIFVDFLQNV
jgi:hypothetical protein